jgi:hypothetical protein
MTKFNIEPYLQSNNFHVDWKFKRAATVGQNLTLGIKNILPKKLDW